MDGFKNTTKTSYDTASGRKFANGGMTVSRNDMAGGEGPMSKPAMVAKYAKGGSVKKGEQKIGRVMREFTEGKLHSGSKEGPKVKTTKQAVAIALNEARAAGAKIPRVKRADGTPMGKGPERARNTDPSGTARASDATRYTKEALARKLDPSGTARASDTERYPSAEAGDVFMARMTKDELAQGAKGVRMARERLERDTVKRGTPPARPKQIKFDDTMEIIRPRKDLKPIKKAVPPSSREPMYGPAKRLSIPLKKGGLSVMPKGKGC